MPTEHIGYTTTNRVRGPFKARNLDLAIAGLKNRILTSPGERAMRPDYGTRVRELVFEQHTPEIAEEIRSEIEAAAESEGHRLELRELRLESFDRGRGVRVIMDVMWRPTGETQRTEIEVSGA